MDPLEEFGTSGKNAEMHRRSATEKEVITFLPSITLMVMSLAIKVEVSLQARTLIFCSTCPGF